MKQRWLLFILLLALPTAAIAQEAAEESLNGSGNILELIDNIFSALVDAMAGVLFFSLGGIPLIVLWLIGGAVFFTLRMSFVNIRAFKHAIYVVAGHYDDPDEDGELTHFQALSAALSATVGLGNIAGVAIRRPDRGPRSCLLDDPGRNIWHDQQVCRMYVSPKISDCLF